MKSILVSIVCMLAGFGVNAQSQAEAFIKEAQQFLAAKNYQQAQLSLQDAINDINNIIAGVNLQESMFPITFHSGVNVSKHNGINSQLVN